ncbi:MAG: acetyl-CoA decarbonylase/synthase complex subunit gamma, partial [Methanomassiliicoccales archaeon]|nr:acetyl-CoA decarbonylase/synthase complex subunit gamma [Methanomassiliicoccales archaeon]
FHPTAYALTVSDILDEATIAQRVERISSIRFERVGQVLSFDAIAVKNDSSDVKRFALATKAVTERSKLPIVLVSRSPEAMRNAAQVIASRRPLLHGADASNHIQMAKVAKELNCPLVVSEGAGLDQLALLVQKVKAAGVDDLVLDFQATSMKQLLERASIVRKVSVKKTFRGLGYPILIDAGEGENAVLKGLTATMKYGSIVLFEDLDEAKALPLFVLRQNIYTDPQVPIQVKPGIYPVNGPNENSPILFTTNFSLTYFTVLSDVEKAKVPIWLLVVDTEGLSVMTAFSAGKLTPESVRAGLDASGAKEKSKRGEIIIPGMVSRMSGKLSELTGLKVRVGPKESSGIPKFLKSR